jgi:6-phospho-beta-glucosidase
VKIVILGGSSTSTPALFRSFAAYADLAPLEFVLVGRTRERSEAVLRASRLVAAGLPIKINATGFSDLELGSALQGADVILVQVRFGGYEGRQFDESLPLQWDVCGDEGLGPGGLSAAWRSWPGMERVLADIAASCPGALVLMLSSPVGLMVGAARRRFPVLRTYGICELPWTTLVDLAALLKAETSRINFDYFGVNHIGWFHRLEFNGRDLLHDYTTQILSGLWPPAELVAACAGFPTKYLRIHYNAEQVLDQQLRQVKSRAEILREISKDSELIFREGNTEQILEALKRRPTPWYEYAVVPIILSFAGAAIPITFFLTYPNGQLEGVLESDALLELPTRVTAGRLFPKPNVNQPPNDIVAVVKAFSTYERKASKAIVERNADLMMDALTVHPWVRNKDIASSMLSKIIAQPFVGPS